MSILVSIQHTQVPLLQGDAVDHDEVVQVVLGRCCSYRDPSGLGNGVTERGESNETEGWCGKVKERDERKRQE